MKDLTKSQLKLAAWAGIIGAFLFVTVFTIEGWLRPGYNALSTYVSALSLGPRGWIQIANFIIFGLLMFLFTRAVAKLFSAGKAPRGGLTLLTIIALCYFFSGPFVMDPNGTPLNLATIHGTIHGILGAVAFILMPTSCFVFLRRFNSDADWYSLRWWTLVLGTISAIAVILLTIVTKFPQFQNVFASWDGLIQRALIIPFMVWVFIFAIALLKESKSKLDKNSILFLISISQC